MSAGHRIRDARKRIGITQKELAKRIGCSQQTIVDIEGQEQPRSRFLSAVVRELGESLEWIETGLGAPTGSVVVSRNLPHFCLETVGRRALDSALVNHESEAFYASPVEVSGMAYTVAVDRMSAVMMDDHLREDEVLFVDPMAPPYLGRLVLVVMPGWDRAEVRLLSSTGGRHFLEVDSDLYPPRLNACQVYRVADEYMAHTDDDVPPALICGTVVFIGREV